MYIYNYIHIYDTYKTLKKIYKGRDETFCLDGGSVKGIYSFSLGGEGMLIPLLVGAVIDPVVSCKK